MTAAIPRTTPRKIEFILFLGILQLSRSVRFSPFCTCRSKICNVSVQFQLKIRKIGRCRSRSPKYPELGRCCCCAEKGKEMYKDLQGTSTAVVYSLNLLFGVLVAVSDMVCLSSLTSERYEQILWLCYCHQLL